MFFLQILLNSLVLSVQVLLLAAGLYLIYMVAQIYHIALASMMVWGAYSFFLLQTFGLPTGLSFALAVVSAGVAGIGSYFLLKPFIQRKQTLLALLFSAALWLACEAGISIIFGSEGKFLTVGVLPTYHFLGLTVTQVGFWSLITGAVTVLLAGFVLFLLPVGRTLRAVRQHPECANVIGIREKKVQLGVFFVASAMAGLIGILTAMNSVLTPGAGNDLIILALIALLVGGVHDFRGTVLATLLVVIIPECLFTANWGDFSVSSSWRMFLVFFLALFLLFLRPKGLFSTSLRSS